MAFPYGEQLETIYPVLENILNNLPYNDLVSCSEINSNWHQTATNILKKRRNITWLSTAEKDKQIVFRKSSNVNYEDVCFSFLVYNYTKIKLQNYVCIHDSNNTAKKNTCMY